ncbi:MAG: T9SS type A sorting domain-containing protein, partial [Bacteroidota bacterium]
SEVLNRFESYRRIDISTPGEWSLWGQPGTDLDLNIDNNIANFSLSATENKVGAKAFYNINNYDLTKAKGLLVVAREDKQPSYYSRFWPKIKFGVQELNGSQYLGTEIPADGDKHWSYIEFENLPVSLVDDNQTLDLDSIWRFVVSTWHAIPEVTVNFEVYEVYIVSDSALFENSEFDVKLEVKNEDTGEKLSDAQILFGDQLFFTDSTGSVVIENIEYGFYKNKVSIEGYYPIEDQYLEVYSDTTITLFLQKDFSDLKLRFTDKSSGEPIYRVVVSYDNITKLSDDEGYILINDLKTDSLFFSAQHSDYFHLSDTISLRGDSTINIMLSPLRADISFYISDSSGEIKNAEIDIETFSGFTNSRGKITFYNQPAGRMYNYVIFVEGYGEHSDSFFLEADTTISFVFDSTVSNDFISLRKAFELYPNPVNKTLNIKFRDPGSHSMLILMNVYGKLLIQKTLNKSFLRLDVSELQRGTYIIGIQVKDQMIYRKIVK